MLLEEVELRSNKTYLVLETNPKTEGKRKYKMPKTTVTIRIQIKALVNAIAADTNHQTAIAEKISATTSSIFSPKRGKLD